MKYKHKIEAKDHLLLGKTCLEVPETQVLRNQDLLREDLYAPGVSPVSFLKAA